MTDLSGSIAELETDVRRALETGDESGLEILGYGEISLVVAHDTPEGRFACKRLPEFADGDSLERYTAVFGEYLASLDGAGIEVVRSELVRVPGDGPVIAYCVQPVLDSASLGPVVAGGEQSGEFLRSVIDTTFATINPRVGLDAQISNWALVDGRLVYLDVTTPFLRNEEGAEKADLELFLSSLPWLMRAPVRTFLLDEILKTYYDPRSTLVDLIGNLHKERLDQAVPIATEAANAHADPPITPEEVRKYYSRDARMWALLQRVRRIDRGWQRHIRRRPYPFLLPQNIDR